MVIKPEMGAITQGKMRMRSGQREEPKKSGTFQEGPMRMVRKSSSETKQSQRMKSNWQDSRDAFQEESCQIQKRN